MAELSRSRQLAERIREIVAECVELRVKDPRLGFVTFTAARLTGDLREASVFYTVYGDEESRQETAAALTSATGIIRTEVGKRLGLKHTPSLTFFLDALPESAAHIDELLARAAAADAEIAEKATGARYAGDADPYKHPEDDEG